MHWLKEFEENKQNMAYNLLKGKKGIIFGALDQNSIAWKTAERIHEEGGKFTLTNTPLALRMGELQKLGEKCDAPVIGADATSIEEVTSLFKESMAALDGKIDFVLHSVAMSPNIRKKQAYEDLNYDWFHKTLDISALSFHKMMHVANQLDAMNEWGSIVALTHIGAQRTFSTYSDMSQAKAMLESIARSFGTYFAEKKKVRVNTISQSPTKTTAGSGISGFDAFFEYSDKLAPLGNASVEDCANYITMMFSDFTRMVTMQNLYHDGGFSYSGMTDDIIQAMTPQ